MSELTLHEKLSDIQQRLKVPKDQDNDFANFKYRNLEDIEDKVKPLLKEHGLTMIFEDDVMAVGERVYIRATVYLNDNEGNVIQTSAFAREAVTPKAKTDDAQLTGACSSYARKYAVSGLFLIDNTKDADSTSGQDEPVKMTPKERADSRKKVWDDGALARAKTQINKLLTEKGYDTTVAKLAFINSVLKKEVITTEQDANEVADALENEE
jgi:hypothetical protein